MKTLIARCTIRKSWTGMILILNASYVAKKNNNLTVNRPCYRVKSSHI